MSDELAAIGGLLVGVGGVGAALVAWSRNRSDSRVAHSADWASFASESREILAVAWEQIEAQSNRLRSLQEALDSKDATIRARDAHIDALRHQVINEIPPPPVDPPIPY